MNVEIQKESAAYAVSIFIGGDLHNAREICETFCTKVGLCVTVTETTYCYRYGRCAGVIVGLINYPRYPRGRVEIFQTAVDLAYKLKHGLGQGSFTVQDDERSVFVSTRNEDQPRN